jgi:hypothetical protein
MKAYQPTTIKSKDKLLQLFKNYYNKYNNIKQMEVA